MLLRPDGTYREIGMFIPWIISGTLLYYLGGYFSPGPSIAKQTYWKFLAFLISATSNAGLNYFLIPQLGILGAGIATTISSLVAGMFNQVISNRLYYVPNRWRFGFAMILGFTIVVSLSQYNNHFFYINNISLISRSLLTIVLGIIGIAPFYNDIKNLGVLQKFFDKVFQKIS